MLTINQKINIIKFNLEEMKKYISEMLTLYKLKLKYPTFKFEKNVQIKSADRLELGNNVLIQRNSIIHCGGMSWCDFKGKIVIGNEVTIGPNCVLYGAGEISIGDYTHLGPGVIIVTQSGISTDKRLTSKPDLSFKPIIIGKGCWVGAGAVILQGTTLGGCCTIGPNSVVKGKYSDNSVLVGNPTRPSISIQRNKDL